jgi:hypothetical protein
VRKCDAPHPLGPVVAVAAATALAAPLAVSSASAAPEPTVGLSLLGTYAAAAGDGIGGEVAAIQAGRMFVTKGATVEIVDVRDPASPSRTATVDLSAYGASVTSVAVSGLTAVATLPAEDKTQPGKAVVLSLGGKVLAKATVGSLPDMATYDATSLRILVANEGEPSSYGQPDSVDPEGSVSVISVPLLLVGSKKAVQTISFTDFNEGGPRADEVPDGIRLFGPGATVAQDLEPEYITVDPRNPNRAFVTLQENNAIAELSLAGRPKVVAIRDLGTIDRSQPGSGFDPSDRDNAIAIANHPVSALPLPDAIAAYSAKGGTFLVTPNEGDVREYDGLTEAARLGSSAAVLDAEAYPNAAALKNNAVLGRLNVSLVDGLNESGQIERIHTYGGRGFSIYAANGTRVFDSGDAFEQITAAANPDFFNSNHDENSFDTRSDDKGPEPEGVAVGTVKGRTYAFIGLERIGGVMVYDVTNPNAPTFVEYVNNRDFTADPVGPDTGAEIVRFVSGWQSPTGQPLLVVSNEVTGTVSLFAVS